EASFSTTDPSEVFKDPNIDLVWIGTRHNLHGPLALQALEAGKNTFVEKPLCLTSEELAGIREFYDGKKGKGQRPVLMVGFNRRFSPYLRAAKEATDGRSNPLTIIYSMNAGFLPPDHWVHGKEGGGRVLGEGCHIIDLFSYLTGSPVTGVNVAGLHPRTPPMRNDDNRVVSLEYEDGSVAVLNYFSGGSSKISKERFEVHFDEKSIFVDDYRELQGFGVTMPELRSAKPDKGHLEELKAIHDCLSGDNNPWPISLESLLETSEIAIQAGTHL
ncbi:Gfo/Idh/MocA family oxidoreductase, partial [Verrucomicrobia bacterium]|nr:Gfo/Idh/MocA family oxidoreductase [Verrucomicrobiota bacterium]